jgi:thiamine-phosphate diphosphorylase
VTSLPVLHVVTDDDVLARKDFGAVAAALLTAHGRRVAVHVRGPATDGRTLHRLAGRLAGVAAEAGALLLVNDRADVALAVGAAGVQLGARSLPLGAARRLRTGWVLGASVHDPAEAETAADEGADFLVLGTIWPTATHPDRPGAGCELIAEVVGRVAAPVVAIGGVTPARAVEAREAGAAGVAAIRGVWQARDPVAAVRAYMEAWENDA